MKKSFLLVAVALFWFTFTVTAGGLWSTEKYACVHSVCYKGVSELYCAGSADKKVMENDLKHYLSVFLYFSNYEVNKSDMILQPGIKRLVKGTRPEDGKKLLQSVYDYLLREGKRKGIMLSIGKDAVTQKVFSEVDQIYEIESVNWPKYIDSSIDSIVCTANESINASFKITNTMKKEFLFKGEEIELRIVGGRYEFLSAGSVKEEKVVLSAGATKTFSVDIPITGEMIPSMRYKIVPFIKNIKASKEDFSVLCESTD